MNHQSLLYGSRSADAQLALSISAVRRRRIWQNAADARNLSAERKGAPPLNKAVNGQDPSCDPNVRKAG